MNAELTTLRFPQEPQRANAGRYAETLWFYGDRVGTIDEVGRVYERDCKEILQRQFDKLLGIVQRFMESPSGQLAIEGKTVNRELVDAVAQALRLRQSTERQAAELLAQRVDEYHVARANHDGLLEYGTDFAVNPDVMSRSADALRESETALSHALTAYRKVTTATG